MYFTISLVLAILFVWQTPLCAQPRPVPPIEVKPTVPAIVDSAHEDDYYVKPNSDSARIFDSLYSVRRTEILNRMKENPYVRSGEFITARVMSTAFGRVRASDLQRYFAERVGRPDLEEESSTISGLDYMVNFLLEARMTNSLGVFAQYSYTGKDYRTTVVTGSDSSGIPKGIAELNMVSQDFTAGPSIIPFSTTFVRLRLYGGLGPAIVKVREYEEASKSERTATAKGLAVVFEAEFDFQIIDEISFGLSLFTKQVNTGELTVDDVGLSSPFGKRTWATDTKPSASYMTACLGVGLRFYF